MYLLATFYADCPVSYPFKSRVKSHLPFASIIRRFNVYGSVNCKCIPIYIQQDVTLQVHLYLETTLRVSGGTSTHHQERIQLYLQHLLFFTPLLLSAAISWNWFECAVGGVRHPQHTQTRSNSSTIAADSRNGVTNTRCCRYSCMRS